MQATARVINMALLIPCAVLVFTAPSLVHASGASHGGKSAHGNYQGPVPEEVIEVQKKPLSAVNLFADAYPYSQKAQFVKNIDGQLVFFDQAIANSKKADKDRKPEAQKHADDLVAAITPKLATMRDVLAKASSSSEGEWSSRQSDARKAFSDLQQTYYNLHSVSK